jgi:arylsulfatase A-like enzyme
MLTRFLCAPLCLLACCWLIVAASAADAAKPNVLFIAVDDLNDWVGCLGGHPDSKTPNIDRLAARGVNFTRAYCAAPACNPSRAALLTGRRPSTSGVYLNSQPWRPAMPDVQTMPQYFSKHGYRTVGGGKIFHGSFHEAAGWDFYQKQGQFPEPDKRPHNGIPNTGHFDWGPVHVDDDAMGDHVTVDWAISELGKAQEKPLFLACGFIRPHLPFYAPAKYFEQYPLDKIAIPEVPEGDLADVPPAGVKMARPDGDHAKVIAAGQHRHAVQAYLASIAYVDFEVGRLLDALDASPLAKNTIVVFWGDHGWHLGEKQHWGKWTGWQRATRVPLAIVPAKGAADIEAGTRTSEPASLLDLYPTLIELCGLPPREGLSGVSLAPLMRDPKLDTGRAVISTFEAGNHAVIDSRWRYIRYADGSEELYDTRSDPHEWTNLAGQPEHAARMKDLARRLPARSAEPEQRPKE